LESSITLAAKFTARVAEIKNIKMLLAAAGSFEGRGQGRKLS
jgi:hypothetical protein